MNTRDFLLLGSGALVGYFLVGIINKREAKAEVASVEETPLPDTSSQTLPPVTSGGSGETLVDPKLAPCQEAWTKSSMLARYSSQKAKETAKAKFIASCLAKK